MWFRLAYRRWKGTCWYFHENTKYEFDLQFEIPVTYPVTPIELELPELDGKTSKMYRYVATRDFIHRIASFLIFLVFHILLCVH